MVLCLQHRSSTGSGGETLDSRSVGEVAVSASSKEIVFKLDADHITGIIGIGRPFPNPVSAEMRRTAKAKTRKGAPIPLDFCVRQPFIFRQVFDPVYRLRSSAPCSFDLPRLGGAPVDHSHQLGFDELQRILKGAKCIHGARQKWICIRIAQKDGEFLSRQGISLMIAQPYQRSMNSFV